VLIFIYFFFFLSPYYIYFIHYIDRYLFRYEVSSSLVIISLNVSPTLFFPRQIFSFAFSAHFCNKIYKFFSMFLSQKFSCKITAVIAGNCVLYYFNSEFTKKINKITNKTNKMTNIFAFLSFLLIFFVNSLLN
jgi:hypothetical protein